MDNSLNEFVKAKTYVSRETNAIKIDPSPTLASVKGKLHQTKMRQTTNKCTLKTSKPNNAGIKWYFSHVTFLYLS